MKLTVIIVVWKLSQSNLGAYIHSLMGYFYSEQILKANITDIWDFFANPHNLQKVSKPSEGFEVINDAPETISEDLIVIHRVRPIPYIPTKWVSQIVKIDKPNYFIDQQIKGPFSFWEHKHSFDVKEEGVLVKDEINFRMPFGFLGKMIEPIMVKKLKKAFAYRSKRLGDYFSI